MRFGLWKFFAYQSNVGRNISTNLVLFMQLRFKSSVAIAAKIPKFVFNNLFLLKLSTSLEKALIFHSMPGKVTIMSDDLTSAIYQGHILGA